MIQDGPIFSSIFGTAWAALPPVFRRHYANRPFCRDIVIVDGVMRVEASWLMRLLSPALRLSRTLPPYVGDEVPVTVTFRSEPDSRAYCFDREFRFPGRSPYHFLSRMEPTGGDEVIEWMRGGIGWRAAYAFSAGQVRLEHRGYALRLFGRTIPLPLEAFFGRGSAFEEALDADRFAMAMSLDHPLLGRLYAYSGVFAVREVRLDG